MNLRTKAILLGGLFVTLCWPSPTLCGVPQNSKTHRVEAGETAYSIAKTYNILLKDLYALNPGVENGVRTGAELVLPQSNVVNPTSSGEKYVYHTIERKETLYSVSRKYSVAMQDIMDANVGLTAETFQEGKVIRIPRGLIQKPEQAITYRLHKVRKGETIYSIAKSYNLTSDALTDANPDLKSSNLKKGFMLKIPQYSEKKLTERDSVVQEEKAHNLLRERSKVKAVNTVRIGLLFPFSDKNDAQSNRFVEYLEGFLLAVEDFKQKGYSAEVYVFDIESGVNTNRLTALLETEELKTVNVLIGGISQDQIGVLSDFAKKQKIRYVIPFNSKNDDVLSNDYVFQMNTPYNYLFSAISQTFVNRFKTAKVIFVNDSGDDKADFITSLQSELQKNKISNTSVQLSENTGTELSALLSTTKPNIIVPTSGSSATLNKLVSVLQPLKKDNPDLQFSLFGYPEWQTYNLQTQDNLRKLDTYFYSSFFIGANQNSAKLFSQRFKSRYGKDLMNVYPKFGLLGYDIGNYFLNIVKLYGVNFDNHVTKYQINSIQSALSFKRVNNWGGFINTGFYFVHYGTSGTEKTDYSK
ncbi:MAG: putative secreted protein [Bacteroidetes bacterium]|jgi:LysM repeat protein|nr:putative secreted protein [Bacteroidota bacterium]